MPKIRFCPSRPKSLRFVFCQCWDSTPGPWWSWASVGRPQIGRPEIEKWELERRMRKPGATMPAISTNSFTGETHCKMAQLPQLIIAGAKPNELSPVQSSIIIQNPHLYVVLLTFSETMLSILPVSRTRTHKAWVDVRVTFFKIMSKIFQKILLLLL